MDLKGKPAELWLIRHGETEWSQNGKHTGSTDLPLTEHGREQAEALRPALADVSFDLLLCSPLQRARDTAALAGFSNAEIELNLQEWDYGSYEGLSTPEIQATHPGWSVWKNEISGGETLQQVAARTQIVVDRCLQHGGRCALFAHAHVFRILTATWLQQDAGFGQRLALSTATISVLGWEHSTRVISRWNVAP